MRPHAIWFIPRGSWFDGGGRRRTETWLLQERQIHPNDHAQRFATIAPLRAPDLQSLGSTSPASVVAVSVGVLKSPQQLSLSWAILTLHQTAPYRITHVTCVRTRNLRSRTQFSDCGNCGQGGSLLGTDERVLPMTNEESPVYE